MILFETRGLQLYWVVRGGIRFAPRLRAFAGTTVYGLDKYFPRTRALVRTDQAHVEKTVNGRGLTRRSRCLRFQLRCVEPRSYLPNGQCNRRHFAR
jgi:hypothetical protein